MDQGLRKRFDALEKQKARLLRSYNEWDINQLHFKPGTDQWSVMQVFDHIIKVDISVTKSLLKYQGNMSPVKLGMFAWWRALFLRLFLLTPVKIKAPNVPGIQPIETSDLSEVFADWRASRSLLNDYLEAFPEDKLGNFAFKHPLSGKLNIGQTLMFIYFHTRHHEYQLNRITSHSNFPRDGDNG